MSDNRVHVIKNIGRLPIKYDDGSEGPIKEYITRADDNGISQPVGFSKEFAEKLASGWGWDLDEAVIVCPDDLVVVLHDSARKLPRGDAEGKLQQMSEGMKTM